MMEGVHEILTNSSLRTKQQGFEAIKGTRAARFVNRERKQQVAYLKCKNDQLAEENARLKQKIQDLEHANGHLTNENARLNQQMEKLDEEMEQLNMNHALELGFCGK